MKFRFIGDPKDNFSGPETMIFRDYTFPRDVWVTIKDAGIIEKLTGHSHYESASEDEKPAPAPAPSPVVEQEPAFEEAPNDDAELYVAKGPRGLWYVKRADKRLSQGFHTEEEALSELHTLSGEL